MKLGLIQDRNQENSAIPEILANLKPGKNLCIIVRLKNCIYLYYIYFQYLLWTSYFYMFEWRTRRGGSTQFQLSNQYWNISIHYFYALTLKKSSLGKEVLKPPVSLSFFNANAFLGASSTNFSFRYLQEQKLFYKSSLNFFLFILF